MPTFQFRARDAEGRAQSGATISASSAAAAADLRARGWLLLELHGSDGAVEKKDSTGWRAAVPFLRPSSREVEDGLRHLAVMLRSGLTLLSALRMAASHMPSKRARRLWASIADRIESGAPFASALADYPTQFPPLICELARAGEQSGTLETALERGSEHIERVREVRRRFVQAVFYPALVVTLTSVVAMFMFVEVMPELEKFLAGTNRKIPALTQRVLDVSHFVREHLHQIAAAIGATAIAIIALEQAPPTRLAFDRFLLRVPILGHLRRLSSTALFARSLHILLDSGISIVRSLELTQGILRRPAASLTIARARSRVLGGSSFAEAVEKSPAFTPWLTSVIAVGESTGNLEHVLQETSKFHEMELQRWLRVAGSLIEPILTIAVGAVVGIVYAAFFIAMFSLAGGV